VYVISRSLSYSVPCTAKKAVYAEWNPAAPRSALNFNPFETFEGNSPDCSGYYPGEVRQRSLLRPWR
jgi:hypothetical protein